ncbi:hypothetical protein [Lysinibacillus capsici]|uniref:hypothetical protein n=1 Tax=Lysinibacillus capsici TaxID=2115968 RepID=UPI002A80B117|nr:hypothetical protein [Lysinibacillus capsici]
MAIILESITHVWFAGRMISPGEVFSADDAFATKLIEGCSAKVANAVDSKDEQPKGRRVKKVDDDHE